MARPRTQDPVTSTTVCVPASVLLRLQTLNTHRQRRGLAAKSPQALMREIIEANLTAYEAYEGYLWNPVANPSALPPVAEAPHPAFAHIPPPVAPPGASFFPLPPPPPHAPTYTPNTPSDAPPLRDLMLAAQERRLGDAKDLPLESFFEDAPPSARPR